MDKRLVKLKHPLLFKPSSEGLHASCSAKSIDSCSSYGVTLAGWSQWILKATKKGKKSFRLAFICSFADLQIEFHGTRGGCSTSPRSNRTPQERGWDDPQGLNQYGFFCPHPALEIQPDSGRNRVLSSHSPTDNSIYLLSNVARSLHFDPLIENTPKIWWPHLPWISRFRNPANDQVFINTRNYVKLF